MTTSHRSRSIIGLFVAATLVSCVPGLRAAYAQSYSAGELLSMSAEDGEGFSRRHFDLNLPELSFSTLVANDIDVRVVDEAGTDAVVARASPAGNADGLTIEVHRLEFPSFAQAISAGHGYLARMGFDRILRDEAKSNHAFALLAAARSKENGGYGEMARAAVVSRGKTVLIALARFDYADYPNHQSALSRFFGGLRMDADVALDAAFQTIPASGGAAFLVPTEWSVARTGKASEARASDFALSLPENEYPNVQCQTRPGGIEQGRELAVTAAKEFRASVEASSQARLDGELETKTNSDASGRIVSYSFAQPWSATQYGLPMIAQFNVQTDSDGNLGFCGLNAFDGQRSAELDRETADMVYRNWVVGISAFAAAHLSLRDGTDAVLNDLDLRRLGH